MSTKDKIPPQETASEDVSSQQRSEQDAFTQDEDVRVLSTGNVDGHQYYELDLTGDGKADVTVIDVDDSESLTDPDVVVESTGNVTTWEAYRTTSPIYDDKEPANVDYFDGDDADALVAESGAPYAEGWEAEYSQLQADDAPEDSSDVTTFTEADETPSA